MVNYKVDREPWIRIRAFDDYGKAKAFIEERKSIMKKQTIEAVTEIHDRIGNQRFRLQDLQDNCQDILDILQEETHGCYASWLQDEISTMAEALNALNLAMDLLKGISNEGVSGKNDNLS